MAGADYICCDACYKKLIYCPESDPMYPDSVFRCKECQETALRKAVAEFAEEAISKIPHNWIDDLLSGPNSVEIPAGCPDIERLLNAITERIQSLKELYVGK